MSWILTFNHLFTSMKEIRWIRTATSINSHSCCINRNKKKLRLHSTVFIPISMFRVNVWPTSPVNCFCISSLACYRLHTAFIPNNFTKICIACKVTKFLLVIKNKKKNNNVLPVMVSASRVVTGLLTSFPLPSLSACKVALAEGETLVEVTDDRGKTSGRVGPTSSTAASLDAVAKSDIFAPPSCKMCKIN